MSYDTQYDFHAKNLKAFNQKARFGLKNVPVLIRATFILHNSMFDHM